MFRLLTTLLVLSFPFTAPAATYYIDWNSGSDTNNGTSKSTPWKRHPDMKGWAGGAFTAKPGDGFILKGGVTWPNAALSLYITDSGTATQRIYIGIDPTWYSGSQYVTWTDGNGVTRQSFNWPTLDAQGQDIVDSRNFGGGSLGTRNNIIAVSGNYITIEGLRAKGVLINDNPDGGTPNPDAGTGHTLRVYGAVDFIGKGLDLSDWVVKTVYGGDVGGPIAGSAPNSTLINCRIKGPENIDPQYITASNGRDYGNGVRGFALVQGCDISRVGQGIWSCSVVDSNIVHTMGQYTDSNAHENTLWAEKSQTIRNNVFRDARGVIYLMPGWGSESSQTLRCHNNLFFNTAQINLTSQGNPDATNQLWFHDNVVKQSGGTCINVGTTKSGAPFGRLVIQNNVFISDSSSNPSSLVNIIDANDLGSQYTSSPNDYLSTIQATALGLSAANLWGAQTVSGPPATPSGLTVNSVP